MDNTFEMRVKNTILTNNQVAMFYLGQEGYLFWNGQTSLLIDPYLSDYIDQNSSRKNPWKRLYPAPVTGEEVGFADYVFCSHDHADHTDPWTIAAIAKTSTRTLFFCSAVFSEKLVQYGIPEERVIPVQAGKEYVYPGIRFTPVPAAHEELHLTEKGYAEMSLKFIMNGVTFFHGGDCCLYDGLTEDVGKADVMLLPVNGRDYFKREENIIGNLCAREAVLFSCECGADMLIPLHYDLYPMNGLPASDFVNAVLMSDLKYHLFRPGERLIYAKE